jgi:SPP1 gp7 family putative phage head morphogenesis protein
VNKVLAPIRHRDAYTRAIESVVLDYFDEVIFRPLVDLFEEGNSLKGIEKLKQTLRIENASPSAVIAALQSHSIWYADGTFSGSFNAAISSELRAMGAKFDRAKGTFHIKPDNLPMDVRGAAAESIASSTALHTTIVATLNTIQAQVGLNLGPSVDKIVDDLIKQYAQTVKGLDLIEVSADITPAIAKAMREQFTENLDLAIKNFVQEEIPHLRADVQANAFAGYRTDRLADIIEARYGVSKRKAAFLADQETGLAVSKFREQRYREVGSRTYKWSTSHDERVRIDHRHLDNQIFSWDNPPITNRATRDRNHPGEDFRCRCVAMPILELPE